MIPLPYSLMDFKPGDRWEYKNRYNQQLAGSVVRVHTDVAGEKFLIVKYDNDYSCEKCFHFDEVVSFHYYPKEVSMMYFVTVICKTKNGDGKFGREVEAANPRDAIGKAISELKDEHAQITDIECHEHVLKFNKGVVNNFLWLDNDKDNADNIFVFGGKSYYFVGIKREKGGHIVLARHHDGGAEVTFPCVVV